MEKVLKFLEGVVDKYGTKFMVVLGADGGIVYLALKDKVDGLYAVIGITLTTIAYFIFRHKEEKNNKPKGD